MDKTSAIVRVLNQNVQILKSNSNVYQLHGDLERIGVPLKEARKFWTKLFQQNLREVTWVVPTFTYRWARTNNRFEVSRTRSEIGWFSESFRILPGVQRSVQPSHSVAALGPLAHSLLSGHEDEVTPFSRKGVWGKLYDADAVILLLGVDPMTISLFHAVEDWSGDPWRHTRHRKHFRLILADGSEIQRSFYLHAPHPGRRNVIPWLQEVGVIKNWKISGVNIYALSSRKLVDALLPLVKRNPGWFHAPWRDSWKGMVGALVQSWESHSLYPLARILQIRLWLSPWNRIQKKLFG